jgi:hypothetical protein
MVEINATIITFKKEGSKITTRKNIKNTNQYLINSS